jgi:hypothetical protein
MFADATAAKSVRSTLTLPLVGTDGGALGTVNLYAASPQAFDGIGNPARSFTTPADL